MYQYQFGYKASKLVCGLYFILFYFILLCTKRMLFHKYYKHQVKLNASTIYTSYMITSSTSVNVFLSVSNANRPLTDKEVKLNLKFYMQ